MNYLSRIPAEPRYVEDDIALMLADSGCDLTNPDQCLDVLVAHGVKPGHFSGDILLAVDMAKAIRRAAERLSKVSADATFSALLPIVIGCAALVGLASGALAADHVSTVADHMTRGAAVLGAVFVGAIVVSFFS